MIYGMTGASGTGKTTLGRAVADSFDVTFVPTSITETAQRHGFKAVGSLSLSDRMTLQRHLLDDHAKLIDTMPRPMILDRTPLDFIGYLMAEFYMHSDTAAPRSVLLDAEKYVEDCLNFTKKHYDFIFLMGKLENYEADPKRPADNPAYHRHFDLIIKGALVDMRSEVKYAIVASEDMEFRLDFVSRVLTRRLDEHDASRKSAKHIH
jgi:nicotinamide riboside kinase